MICQTVLLTLQEIFCRLKNFVTRFTKIVMIALTTVKHRMRGFFPQSTYLVSIILGLSV